MQVVYQCTRCYSTVYSRHYTRVYIRPTRKQELPRILTERFRLSWGTRGRRAIEIGLLKAAYLAVFAILGVEFAKAKALRKVREQIAQPDEKLLAHFCLRSEQPRGRAVCLVTAVPLSPRELHRQLG